MLSLGSADSVLLPESGVLFKVEVMRNGKEEGNTFFNTGKHLSQMSLLLGDPREEVEHVSLSIQGRRPYLMQGKGSRKSSLCANDGV